MKVLVVVAIIASSLLGVPVAAQQFAQQPIATERLAGDNRQQTSAAIAVAVFDQATEALVLAQDSQLPQALAAGMADDRPILLVPQTGDADPATLAALDDLGVQTVIAVGPDVDASVLDQLAVGRSQQRIGGASLTSQTAALAEYVSADGTVYLARSDDLADGLAAGVLPGGPLAFLEADQTLAEETIDFIDAQSPDTVTIIGGVAAVPQAVEDRLAQDRTVVRIAGASRYETAVRISQSTFPPPGTSATVYLSRADIAPDAVVAGTVTDGPILLADSCPADSPTAPPLSQFSEDEIGRLTPARIVGLGGTAALCDNVLAQASGETPQPAPVQLGADGLSDDLPFGTPMDIALAQLITALGQPAQDTGFIPGCEPAGSPIERYVTWGDQLTVVFGEQADPRLLRYFYREDGGGQDPLGLSTERGIGLGSASADVPLLHAGAEFSDFPEDNVFGDYWLIPGVDRSQDRAVFVTEDQSPARVNFIGSAYFCE